MKAILTIVPLLAWDITNAAISPNCKYVSTVSLSYCPMLIMKELVTKVPQCCCHPMMSTLHPSTRTAIFCGTLYGVNPKATTTTTTTTTTPTTTTTLKPPEFLVDMIDQTSSIWLHNFEDKIVNMDEGNDEIRIIDSSTVQEENIDQGMFVFRVGLCGQISSVSVESKLEPGRFLRHQNGKIKLQTEEDNDSFRQDSCFNVVTDTCPNGGFALQSVNNPDKVIIAVQKFNQMFNLGVSFSLRNNHFEIVLMTPTIYLRRFYCWANPVSQQANLAFCSTNVTNNDDLYEHPECCNHEGTLENFGECCRDMDNIGGCSLPMHKFCLELFLTKAKSILTNHNIGVISNMFENSSPYMLQDFPQCCKVAYILEKIQPGAIETCRQIGETERGLKRKRSTAACNMPCWQINYCPWKMRTVNGWDDQDMYPQCCCHPYRTNVMQRRGIDFLGTCSSLG